MDENHQDAAGSKQIATEDIRWVFNKRNKLWIPQHKKQRWKAFKDKFPFDWLNLFGILAIPFVVTVIGLYATQQITFQQAHLSEEANQQQHQTDLQIANDRQQEATLQGYLDHLSDLLLNDHLRESKPGDVVRNIARARTLTAVRGLDGNRKALLIQFLYQAQLINIPKSTLDHNNPIISLTNVDLGGILLAGTHMSIPMHMGGNNLDCSDSSPTISTDLSGVDLSGANLTDAMIFCPDLTGADLSNANLTGIGISAVDLKGANLSKADFGCLGSSGLVVRISKTGEKQKCAYLDGVDLSTANLSSAILIKATLHDTRLSDAQLSKAHLIDANLNEDGSEDVDLSAADLSFANLSGATISQQQLDQVSTCKGAILPKGLTCHYNQ